ncbi:MAG: hypothetical protein KAU62_12960 [Candidatus Heimdallarchaeota archaeon]|nr:hypothetical protein [Candidatus Heimdallarchaeota archaeon]MCK4612062.1 hypothetical protein [Candidatus Heimdallarchaeota archaeon]
MSKRYWYINLIALGLIVLHFSIKVIRRRFFSIEKLLLEDKSESDNRKKEINKYTRR